MISEVAAITVWPTTFGTATLFEPFVACQMANPTPASTSTSTMAMIVAFRVDFFLVATPVTGPPMTSTGGFARVEPWAATTDVAPWAASIAVAPPATEPASTGSPSENRSRSARNSSALW